MANKKPEKAAAETPVNNVELFGDDAEVITLHDDKDNPVDFIQIAGIDYEGHFYALLKPVQSVEGIGEDEVVIFRLEEGKNDDEDDMFMPVESEELLNKVFDQYLRAVADENDSCDCEDCCDDEGCDCGHEH